MRQDIRLGTFSGVAVGVNWSVLLILGLFVWELAEYQFPSQVGHPTAGDWMAGLVGALGLLASLLVHEISHAVVARRNDVGVRSITLFIFGGVAQLQGEAHTPGADFRIAAVGPTTSLVTAGFFGVLHAAAVAAGAGGLPVAVLVWLAEINVLLAVFNVIPAAPLDGGRILRAGLWRYWGDRLRASVAAARAGKVFGFVLIGLGALTLLYAGATGLWAVLIGFFLYSAARGEERYALVQQALSELRVGQVMTPHPPVVPANVTVADLVSHYLWHYQGEVVAVADESGRLSGIVTAHAVRLVPADRRHATIVSQIAVPIGDVAIARPEDSMNLLLERIASNDGRPALVLQGEDQLVGVVTLADVERAAASNAGGPWGSSARR
jgi:Zn-dependent protease